MKNENTVRWFGIDVGPGPLQTAYNIGVGAQIIGAAIIVIALFFPGDEFWSAFNIAGCLLVFFGVALAGFAGEKLSHVTDLRISKSNQAAAEANERAASLALELERERKARLDLLAKLAPRDLSLEQLDKIGTELLKYAGQQVEVLYFPDDLETVQFASTLVAVLDEARWELVPTQSFLGLTYIAGIEILYRPDRADALFAPAEAISRELNSAGIQAKAMTHAALEADNKYLDMLSIRVGKKPLLAA